MLAGTIDGMPELLDRIVARGTPVFALTNFSTEKWPVLCAAFDFPQKFDGVLVSGEEKLVKPDPAFFELAIQRFGLVAEQTFFIDDRLENVEAAQALNMVGHHFTDAVKLETALKQQRIL